MSLELNRRGTATASHPAAKPCPLLESFFGAGIIGNKLLREAGSGLAVATIREPKTLLKKARDESSDLRRALKPGKIKFASSQCPPV
jgi:hypothetical protein